MVAFSIPAVPRRLLPFDGRWHGAAAWRDTMASLVDAQTAAAATNALLDVFTPEWAASIPDETHQPHPFEYWFSLGGGMSRLARLGYALHLIGTVPGELRARLLHPAEYEAAEAEARAAALFVRVGAGLEWPSRGAEVRPDFVVCWSDGTRMPVEVKQLGDGDQDRALGRIDTSFQDGLHRGLEDALRDRSMECASRAVLSAIPDELLPLVDAEDGSESAYRLGQDYGARWGALVCTRPAVGTYDPRPGLVVEILREGRGHHWEAAGLAPGAQVDRARLVRNQLRHADRQVTSTGLVGIAILERRWPPIWSSPVIDLVGRVLPRFEGLGAVIMREADLSPTAARSAEVLHVLPGLHWDALPSEARTRLAVGRHRFDLLSARRDDFELARAPSPAARFAEAAELMRLGYQLQRARLRREHPDATQEELGEMVARWVHAHD
jgi:hypothetical protein